MKLSEMNTEYRESPVRDLARQLCDVARNHVCYSQVADFMNHVNSHLSAIAYAEEVHQRDAIICANERRSDVNRDAKPKKVSVDRASAHPSQSESLVGSEDG